MARVISLEEYNRQHEIHNKKKNNNKDGKLLVIVVILGLIVVLLSIYVVYLKINTVSKKSYIEAINTRDRFMGELEEIDSKGQGWMYIKNKIHFFDDNVVFQIEGFGNYYYSYDCMREKVNGAYSFLAYNEASAKARGLVPGNC